MARWPLASKASKAAQETVPAGEQRVNRRTSKSNARSLCGRTRIATQACPNGQATVIPTIEQSDSPADAALREPSRPSQPAKEEANWGQTLLFGALAAALLCWVAFYNGYPIVTGDSGGYLYSGAFHVGIWPFRAPGYGAFMKWTRLGISNWLTIAAQAVIVVYVLHEALAYLIGGKKEYVDRCLLYGTCILAALTGLPWLVSELMPDVFAGVLLLCAFLLAFDGELHVGRRIVLFCTMTMCVASHTSLLPIALLFFVALIVLRLVDRQSLAVPPIRHVLAWLLVPIIAAGFYTAFQNQAMGLGFSLSPTKNYFLLGRLFGNGMAQDFLLQNCPTQSFISCRYLPHLPHHQSEFLFQHPLINNLRGHDDEVKAIIRGAIFANPGRFVIASAKEAWLQLFALRTGGDTRLQILTDANFYDILRVIPKEFQPFFIAKQFNDRLFPLTDALASVHVGIFWLSATLCFWFAWQRRFALIDKFLVSAVLFLVINAAVCGALSGLDDRYQGRVAWVMPFCLFTYLCCALREWKSGTARQDPIHS